MGKRQTQAERTALVNALHARRLGKGWCENDKRDTGGKAHGPRVNKRHCEECREAHNARRRKGARERG